MLRGRDLPGPGPLVWVNHGTYDLATEYVPGKNLRAWWKEKQEANSLPDETTRLEIVAQIADALQAVHQAGVIHRDVKPTNILVSTEPEAYASKPAQQPADGSDKHSLAHPMGKGG